MPDILFAASLLLLATLAIAAVVIVARSLRSASSVAVLLTPAERKLYRTLRDALGDDYAIFPQTPISALIEIDRSHPRGRNADKIGAKTVDFTVCYAPKSEGAYILAYCIELDDATHDRPDRQARDAVVNRMFHEAGVPLVRIPTRALRSKDEVCAIIRQSLRRSERTMSPSSAYRPAYRIKSRVFTTTAELEALRRAMNVDRRAVVVPFVRWLDSLPRSEQARLKKTKVWPASAMRIIAVACDRRWRIIAQSV